MNPVHDTITSDESWETLKVAALFTSRVKAARREAAVLFLQWIRRYIETQSDKTPSNEHGEDQNSDTYLETPRDTGLSSLHLHSALCDLGLPEGDINELLLAADQDCNGSITLHEFECYGMRFLNPHFATFRGLFISDAGHVKAHRPTDMMKFILGTRRALSAADKATLSKALAFYSNYILRYFCYYCFHNPSRFTRCCCSCYNPPPHLSTAHVAGAHLGTRTTPAPCKCAREGGKKIQHGVWCGSCLCMRCCRKGLKTQEDTSQEQPVQAAQVQDAWSSGPGVSKTLRHADEVNLVAQYYSPDDDHNDDGHALPVRGGLNIKMKLIPGERLDVARQEHSIETTRALFLRIFSCRALTSRQILRFVFQCEQWEDELKLRYPQAVTLIASQVEHERDLSHVAQRSFEELSVEDSCCCRETQWHWSPC